MTALLLAALLAASDAKAEAASDAKAAAAANAFYTPFDACEAVDRVSAGTVSHQDVFNADFCIGLITGFLRAGGSNDIKCAARDINPVLPPVAGGMSNEEV
jgi:hypothetical protein